jgi:Tetracyclin repressor-like, C-terminal domain
MPAASLPPTSIGISQAAARSSTRSRPTTCTRPNARRLLARTCNRDSARDRLSGFLSGLNTALIIFADREPQVSELLADATTEQWPCYIHHDARLIRHITRILAAASASGEFRLVSDAGQEARRVKAAACALVEPDVILSYRDRYDAVTREAVSRLIAAALSNQSVSPSRASRHAD